MDFRSLHQQESPLLIGNVWDARSAQIFEKLNFQAIGTSSAAVANMLGYEDGGQISFSELEFVVKRIISATSLPLSVDIENGYGEDISTVAENIERLHKLGVVGINIEDSVVDNGRKIMDTNDFQMKIVALKNELKRREIDMFINVRTDTFLLGIPNALDETLKRVNLFEQAGADGIFVPCIEKKEDIARVVSATSLPVNVMCMPNLPDFDTLKSLGVKRISMGNFLHQSVYNFLEQKAVEITSQGSFKSIF